MKLYDIFIYGTLRQGGMYADYLINSELIKERYRLSGFAIYDYQQWYPFMIRQHNSTVVGDIYRVNEITLSELHELEGIEEQLFRFVYLDNHQCYTYLKYNEDLTGLKYIETGDWLHYQQTLIRKP